MYIVHGLKKDKTHINTCRIVNYYYAHIHKSSTEYYHWQCTEN